VCYLCVYTYLESFTLRNIAEEKVNERNENNLSLIK
jgi:hypothetical protein